MSLLAGRRICLISSGHLGSNPRLVKEADALYAAGANVHVIALDITAASAVQARDAAILARAPWTCERVRLHSRLRRLYQGLLRRCCRQLFRWGLRWPALVQAAFNPVIANLAAAATATKAELYIGHNLGALPAAWQAARKYGARLGFDAEDFHSGEYPENGMYALSIGITRWIEQRYLPHCDYVTAAAPGIARAYAALCAIKEPVVILNVFPLTQAPPAATAHGTAEAQPSLYWFSQTIGAGRGLEVVIEALALARCRPVLYLQGSMAGGYEQQLDALLRHHGLDGRLKILAPALPDELVRLAAGYDAGLASEIADVCPNKAIALSNKLFTCLLAGTPVLASDTPAQAETAKDAGEVVQLYPQHDSKALAAVMDAVLGDPVRLRDLRAQAWQLGQRRYNWELEQQKLLAVVALVLALPTKDKR